MTPFATPYEESFILSPKEARELSQKILHYYDILEIELEKKNLDLPNIPMCSAGELVVLLQKMVIDTRGYL